MANSIQDLLDNHLGLGTEQPQVEKVASQTEASSEIEKLAKELGIDTEKTEPESQVQTKEASAMLDSLYDGIFAEDAGLNKAASQEKTAEQEKVAAYEEKLGARSFDKFASRFDARIEKLAADAEASQALPNNKPADAEKMIGTDGKVTNIVTPQKGAEVVGQEQAEALPEGAVKAAAYRKMFLLSQMETE